MSLLFILVFSLLGCENPISNPFKAGLGPIVDIRPPTIKLYSPEVDSFIRGRVTFTGFAEDDLRLDKVEIKIVNYPDLPGNPWPDWTPMDVLRPDGTWSATVETLGNDPANPIFPDGFFKIRLRAIDQVGTKAKESGDKKKYEEHMVETGDIVFTVKNNPPMVALTLPSVTEGTKAGEAGSYKINYGWAGDFHNNDPAGAGDYRIGVIFPSVRVLDTGAVVTGTIQDKEGIVFPAKDGTGNYPAGTYPPQYRFWKVDPALTVPEPNPIDPDDISYPPGWYPEPPFDLDWKDFEDPSNPDANLRETGVNQYLFSYKVPGESDCYYGIEVRVQSKDGKKFHYPRDCLPDYWWRTTDTDEIDKKENGYVLFYARLPQEYPTIDLYQLQDIFGVGAWGDWDANKPPYYRDIPDIDINGYHEYVNGPAVFKSGAFTLRVKASHSRRVDEARVFWERSDKTAKGLFVWDPADKSPGGDTGGNIATTRRYEEWGYNDLNQKDTRNFIFTYTGVASSDTIPNTAEYDEFVRGRYKILRYTGSQPDWKNDKNRGSWSEYRTTQGRLEEGTYEITGETANGNQYISKPLCTITIDEVGPSITLNVIDGSLEGGDGESNPQKPYTVNGVVRPRFGIYDARPRDSGLRPASADTNYFKRENGRQGDEIRYMVIAAADEPTMNTYLNQPDWNGSPWPPLPGVVSSDFNDRYENTFEKRNTISIPGVTVYKNGPVLDGSFMFKTTKIYEAAVPEDDLPDGDYLIYVLARDNAFNVSWKSYPIIVAAATDIPKLEFRPEGAIANVIKPSYIDDYPNSNAGEGFVVNNGLDEPKTLNKWGANTTLVMRLTDDDSLDLGDQRLGTVGKPGTTITITATTSTVDGTVTPVAYGVPLTDAQILGIFVGQQVNDATQNRVAVRERQGTIQQSALLQCLKDFHLAENHNPLDRNNPANPYNQLFGTVAGDTQTEIDAKKAAYQTSLPEGIYLITVTVKDYRPLKLKLPFETEDPIAAEVEKKIWIAVDSTAPFIDRGSVVPPENDFLPSDEDIPFKLKVSDKNGPITLKSFTSIPNVNLSHDPDPFVNKTTDNGVWEADFVATVNLGGAPTAVTFIFEFQDRFGNANQPLQIRYTADMTPPVVNLTRMIRTFEREPEDPAAVILRDPLNTAPIPNNSVNKTRLTNGVVWFEVSATDNSGVVAGLRWWLLPAKYGSTGPGIGGLVDNNDGIVTKYDAYPFTAATVKGEVNYLNGPGQVGGAYGEIDLDKRPYRVNIDTEQLHGNLDINGRGGDGEYRLHIIAVDKPGNESSNPPDAQWTVKNSIWQEIFVLQEQDRPFFENFSPDTGDVVDNLIIMGTIYDDHGFDNNGVTREDSVRIWLSNSDSYSQTELDDFLLETSTTDTIFGFNGPVDIKPGHFTRAGKNINVRIDLNDPDYAGKIDTSDGPKGYIIEATDSYNSSTSTNSAKIKIEPVDPGWSAAGEEARRLRRQYYSFDYDSRDPVIVLEEPETGKSFGITAGTTFNLKGYIEDAYLKLENGNYYIKWRLDNGPIKVWEFKDTDPDTGLGLISGNTKVEFNIPAPSVTGPDMLDFADDDKVKPGQHILTLIVEDQSNKSSTAVLTFIKDALPPDFEFTNIDKLSVSGSGTLGSIQNWWVRPSGITEKDWYDAKRDWLAGRTEQIAIYYDTGAPELTGIFTDATSDIDELSIRYFFDDKGTVPPQTDWTGAMTEITLEGSGRNVRWTIYLTENGLKDGEPLPDGIHTIRLTVADVCGNRLNEDPNAATTYMYAFRIVSSVMPVAEIITKENHPTLVPDVTGYGYNVFGNATGFDTIVFTIIGTAESPNLQDIRLKIVETFDRSRVLFDSYLVKDASNPAIVPIGPNTTVWEYDTSGGLANPPLNEKIKWTQSISQTWYGSLTHGTSYDVVAVAVGRSANPNGIESDEEVWTFTPDMEGPVITFAGNAKTSADGTLTPSRLRETGDYEVMRSSALKVQGGVADGVSRITAMEYKLWKWNYITGIWEVFNPESKPHTTDWINMPGFDAANNTSTDINWTLDLSATTLVGGVQVPIYPQGLYRIKVQAKDASYIRIPATPERIADGDFNTGGMGNPVTSDYMYFFYDRFGPDGFNPTVDSFYSSRPGGGKITFEGTALVPYTVKDPNRIRSVTVEVTEGPGGTIPAGMTSTPWTPANLNIGPEEVEWSLTLNAPFEGTNAVPDGRYRLKFIAEDMAGNTSIIERTFTLDNTAPVGTIILPEKRTTPVTGIPDYTSVVVIGGEPGEITGSTVDRDTGGNRAESGVKSMWYHLGYINPDPFTPIGDARSAYTNYFMDNEVWKIVPGITRENDSGANDADFDAAAKATGPASRAWFKYEATNAAGGPWPHPTGFIINNINIYDWRMELPHHYPSTGWDLSDDSKVGGLFTNSSSLDPEPRGGFKQYANPIKIKGRDYVLNGAGARMTIPVPEIIAGQAGVVSMPLWIRVVDNAGNVGYSCRDIWFYPDGDIPSTSILNPEQATGTTDARGGTISADGVAANNTAVYSVIYRIKADNNQDPTAIIPPASLNNQIVRFPNDSTELTLGNYPLEYAKFNSPSTQAYLSGGGWYHANLEVARGEPIAPWNFLFNTGGEITNMIPTYGFYSSGSTTRDMIRVHMEVFVFSGSIAPEQISVAGGTKDAPLPYVRTFYLKEGAPQIPHVWVSTVDNNNKYRDPSDTQGVMRDAVQDGSIWYEPYRTGLEPRRDKFYIRAELKAASGQELYQIILRRPNETVAGSGYQTVWQDGAYQGSPSGVTVTPTTPARQDHVIVYALDSKATASTTAFASVNGGGWATSGGRYGFEIRIRDNSRPSPGEISYILEVDIDNFAPVADPYIVSSKKAAGTAVDFIGRVYDYQGSPNTSGNMPRKVDRVYVWFTKAINGQTNYVNFNDGSTQLQSGNSGTRTDIFLNRNARVQKTGDTVTNIDFTGTNPPPPSGLPPVGIGAPGTVTFPGSGTGTGATFNVNDGWVKEISEEKAQPGSNMTWIPTGVWDIQWVFRTDTTKMPDGRITLNYVVVDGAGNASFYTQDDIFIRNKYPEISRVTLYTDNNGVGAVYTTHDTNSVASTEFELRDGNGTLNYDNSRGYLNSGFISKNQFIGFKVETLLGNAPLNYRLQYVTRESIPLTETNLQRMVNERNTGVNLYTIAVHGDYSNNNWAMLGVNISAPPLGTHFVFTPETLTTEMKRSDSARVWRYTVVGAPGALLTRTPPAGQPGTTNGVNNPVLPNESTNTTEPGHNFNFNRAAGHFKPAEGPGTTNPTGIGEFDGSHPDEDDPATDNPARTAFFLIKVWDTVNDTLGAPENDQLYDAVVIGMNVYLNDGEAPKSRLYDLNPYAETAVIGNNIGDANQQTTRNRAMDPRGLGENILRGGLYNTGTADEMAKSGHIEPRDGTTALIPQIKTAGMTTYVPIPAEYYWPGDLSLPVGAVNRQPDGGPNANENTFTQDQVSGKLILRGVAWDNQLIREIRVRIGNAEADTTDRAILRLDLSGNMQSNPNYRTLQPVNGAQAMAVEEMHWKTGHTAEWAYIWDTEVRPNGDGRPAGNVQVYVTVIDELGGTYNGTTYAGLPSLPVTLLQESQATETFHNTVTVDIVPYVSGFERDSRFATKRSRQGWYSFYQGETGIRAIGFNLGTGSGTTMRLYTSSAATYTTLPVAAQNKNSVTFSIPDTATSGKISLWVGDTQEALNHRTGHTTQSWNREYHTFTKGSDLWVNKSFAHIWRSTNQTGAPVTFFGNDSRTGGSWSLERPSMALEYTGNDSGRLTGVWAIYGTAGYYYGRNTNTARTTIWDDQGEPLRGTDVSFYNGATANGAAVAALEMDGRPYLQIAHGNNFGTRVQASEQTDPSPTNRWMHNRVSRSASYSHVSSYDSYNRRLYYSRGNATADRMTIDGNGAQVTGNNNTWGTITTSSNAGQYSAIDYDSTGPVIAYYDTANDTIRLAYASQENPAAGNWTRRYLLPDTHSLFRGSGTYVSIKVDRSNNIHLAFYNSVHKTVVYAVGTRTGNFTAYTVDNVVEGGNWTDVSVDNSGNPTIVYADNARTGNYDGIRMAYKSSGTVTYTGVLSCPVTNELITGWEAMTVPADFQVMDDRLNVEVWPPTVRGGTLGNPPAGNWNAAVGYASRRISGKDEGMFRLAYFYQPVWKDYTE